MKKYPVYNVKAEKVKEVKLNSQVFEVPVKEAVVHQVAVAQMANARKNIAHTKTRGEVRGGGAKPWQQKGTGRARHGSIRSPIWVGGGVTFGPRKHRNYSQKVNKKMKRKALFMCLSDKVSNNLLILLDKLNLENGKTKEVVDVIKNIKEILEIKEIHPVKSSEAGLPEAEFDRVKRNKKSKQGENGKEKETEQDDSPPTGRAGTQETGANIGKFDIKKYKLSLLVVLPKSDKKTFKAGRNLQGVKIITADSLNVVDLLRYKKILMLEDGLKVIEKTYLKTNSHKSKNK